MDKKIIEFYTFLFELLSLAIEGEGNEFFAMVARRINRDTGADRLAILELDPDKGWTHRVKYPEDTPEEEFDRRTIALLSTPRDFYDRATPGLGFDAFFEIKCREDKIRRLLAIDDTGDKRSFFELVNLFLPVALAMGKLIDANMLAKIDKLTGLLDAGVCRSKVETEIARMRRKRDRRVCVCLLDLDHFKSINDTYGHPVGDEVLRCFGRFLRLKNGGQDENELRFRREDFVGRFGGEEFLLIMEEATPRGAKNRLEEMLAEWSRITFSETGQDFRVSFSAGVALLSPDLVDHHYGVLKRADDALYEAKKAGRACVMIDPDSLS
ncbi:GGDEF domain-containing protein [Patescibacteria group bacterium]|nr:GGDEF domain-containing protein [Patescibacteria group bacterium]MBU1673772.1 GGDEF domain-containing protein [Patescibacteria group bacterium]MBU1964112.1 GGDEF domain-containing protein [Patescibacteria group bacterium]